MTAHDRQEENQKEWKEVKAAAIRALMALIWLILILNDCEFAIVYSWPLFGIIAAVTACYKAKNWFESTLAYNGLLLL